MMLDLGRSTDSSHIDSRDLLEVVLEKKDEEQMEENEPRLTTFLVKNNLNINRPISLCRRSPNLSRQSLASDTPDSDLNKIPNIDTFIYSLAALSVASLILGSLAFVALTFFINMQSPGIVRLYALGESRESSLSRRDFQTNSTDHSDSELCKVGVALSTLVLAACLCCLLVCSMQCFFASKILKRNEGEERADKFLRECSSSRVFAVTGFFVSIPVFLADIVFLLVLQLANQNALTGAIILGVGALFCVLSVIQNCYHWRVEKSRADEGLPVYDSRFSFPKSSLNRCSPKRRPELCTLV